MDIKCPVCGSNIIYEREDDGVLRVEILDNDYNTKVVANKSYGGTYVYCSKNQKHKLPNELVDDVCNNINDFNY